MILLNALLAMSAQPITEPSLRDSVSPASPPIHCDVMHGSWCLQENAVEEQVTSSVRDATTYRMRPKYPTSSDDYLMLIVPRVCESEPSDRMNVVAFDLDKDVGGTEVMDELRVALTQRCTVTVRLPPWTGRLLEWPYGEGLGAIRQCTTGGCDGNTLWEAVKPFATKYQRRSVKLPVQR